MTLDQTCMQKGSSCFKIKTIPPTRGKKKHMYSTGCKISDQNRRCRVAHPKLIFFPLLVVKVIIRKQRKRVGELSFYASVRSRASFLVAPLPKRLCGGNTASGCPCPSLFLSLFLSCSLSLMFPLVSHVPSSPPFPPHLCLSLFAQSVAVVQASHRVTRLSFPSTILPLFLPLISPHLSSSSLSPLSSSFFFLVFIPIHSSTPPPSLPQLFPHLPHASVSLPLLLLMEVKQQNALPTGIIFTKHTVGQNRRGKKKEKDGARLLC